MSHFKIVTIIRNQRTDPIINVQLKAVSSCPLTAWTLKSFQDLIPNQNQIEHVGNKYSVKQYLSSYTRFRGCSNLKFPFPPISIGSLSIMSTNFPHSSYLTFLSFFYLQHFTFMDGELESQMLDAGLNFLLNGPNQIHEILSYSPL